MSIQCAPPPALTGDLERKRDVLRNQLGRELGDRAFREWLERSLAAVTPEPAEEAPVAEAPSNNGQKAVAQADQSLAAPEAAPGAELSNNAAAPVVRHEPAKMTHNGACVPRVADKTAGPAVRPTTQRERLTRRWSAEEVSTLYRLHAEGLTPQAIADRLGRSKTRVLGCADRHDLKFGRRRKEPEAEPSAMRAAHDTADDSAPGDAGAGAIPAERESEEADYGPAPCAPRNGHDARSPAEDEPELEDEGPEGDVPEPQPAPRDGCLWIDGHSADPGWPTWCGAPRSPGRSYCPEHCVRAYRTSGNKPYPLERFHSPPPKRERRRAHA